MSKSRIINMVYTECDPGVEAEFNTWYNEVHIPMLLKHPGLKKVTRYERYGKNKKQARYLAVYEYDTLKELKAFPKSAEFKAAMEEAEETWKDGGFEIKGTAVYQPIETWEK